ncbi:ATPase [Candidatus Kaiserbacteria bacterium CG10_big_fil_rev_8_21_14_0_10_43_70]|uniref:ATPase n=1 Tax=Candidatus Kaiserbacteria bacterium CG10_big_fil_rev_8_21_14_0_10_43_70 TaxID=1974605 RepID=A0A2H0UJ74_9BACT|nr:MAG: ATPase [Candidatus Kaiserbacteria bacterium CG10_big_fil_rev_8_21_14_0_10_43_70]
MRQFHIIKADGQEELFDEVKLDDSLKRVGASERVRKKIIDHIIREMRDKMTTSEIYKHAFNLLKKDERHPIAARYSVKKAIFDLGPSGFPFEQFVSQLFLSDGWKTQTGVAMNGKCTSHEVDVLAEKNGKKVGIEVKFHNAAGTKTDVKDALYVYARFEDLKESPDNDGRVDDGSLVTNTRFTRNAVRYGKCSGLNMIGWDYPRGKGILDMIETSGVHPLTCLTTLTDGEKRHFLERNMVLCKDITQGTHLLEEFGISSDKIKEILDEASQLCVSRRVGKVDTN